MEYRKLISFGKSSYVVSLPKSWIVQNKLKKGDLIYLEESGPNLMLSKQDQEESKIEQKIIINVDGKSLNQIKREVNSSYILNYRTIVLKGEKINTNIKNLQNIFQNLIALEMMEQTPNSLVAKDFLNMEKVSISELIHKMDIVTRTMFKESYKDYTLENYENVNERDKDVNRLYFLLYRAVLYNFENPLKALKNFKLNPVDLLNILFNGFYIEGIADEVRRTARYACNLKMNEKESQILKKFMDKLYQYYLDNMKAIYSVDQELALKLSDMKTTLNKELDSFEENNKKNDINSYKDYISMINRVRRLISYIHSLGRTVYQGYNYCGIVKETQPL